MHKRLREGKVSARGSSESASWRSKPRGIRPNLLIHRPHVAEALAEAQPEREGGLNIQHQ